MNIYIYIIESARSQDDKSLHQTPFIIDTPPDHNDCTNIINPHNLSICSLKTLPPSKHNNPATPTLHNRRLIHQCYFG